MRILIKNGLVIDPANNIHSQENIYIEAGRIVALGSKPDGFKPQKEIDASDKIVCPGLVDLCARMREPGHEQKADITSETKAAAASGITTLCHPPDTQPIIDTPAVAELIYRQSQQAGYATVLPIGALTKQLNGQELSEMATLQDAGCIGVANIRPINDTNVLRRALEYAATFNITVFLTPQDAWLAQDGCAHDGPVATQLGLPGIPASAETSVVAKVIALVEEIGVRVHFLHLSTARAAQMIGRAQYDGHKISCDVCAHQLFLTEMDLDDYNSNCHVIPPLRSQRDKEGLRETLSKNIISCITSDHQPHEADAKNMPFGATEPGISSLETLLPLTLKLVEEGVVSLPKAIARLTSGPAKVLGLDSGTLTCGEQADICIFDPEKIWTFKHKDIVSRGHNTPFIDWQFKGKVTHTLHTGRIVYEQKNESKKKKHG